MTLTESWSGGKLETQCLTTLKFTGIVICMIKINLWFRPQSSVRQRQVDREPIKYRVEDPRTLQLGSHITCQIDREPWRLSMCVHDVFLTMPQKIILARVTMGPRLELTPTVGVRLKVGPADSILYREQDFDESWEENDGSFTVDSDFDDYQYVPMCRRTLIIRVHRLPRSATKPCLEQNRFEVIFEIRVRLTACKRVSLIF